MTDMPRPRTLSLPIMSPFVLPLALLGTGATVVLAGLPALSLLPVGGLMLWGLREAGSRSAARRVGGDALTLIALLFVVAVSMPVFLPAAADQLVVAGLGGAALVAVLISAPAARSVLRPRRPQLGDYAWFAGAFTAVLAVGVATLSTGVRATGPGLATIVALVLLVPMLHEALYRGLLMHAVGASAPGVVLVALAQGFATAPLFGWVGVVAGGVLGATLGVIRARGDWQTSLFAHWGVALGLAAAFVDGGGVR